MYDKETKILTDKGWKHFNEVEEIDKIAHVKNNKIHYKSGTIISEEYKGNMENIFSSFFDICVTPDSKIYASECNHILQNRKIVDKIEKPVYLTIDEMKKHSRISIINTANFNGEQSIGHDKASLLAMIATIGLIVDGKLIIIPNSDSKDIITYITNLFETLKINYQIKEEKIEVEAVDEIHEIKETSFIVNDNINWIYRYLYKNTLAPRYKLLQLHQNELDIMFATINFISSEIKTDKIHFITNNKDLLEWYRVLCVHLNLRTRIFVKKSFYTGDNIEVSRNTISPLYQHNKESYFKEFKYEGIVYGVNTNENIIINRNNKICIANSK